MFPKSLSSRNGLVLALGQVLGYSAAFWCSPALQHAAKWHSELPLMLEVNHSWSWFFESCPICIELFQPVRHCLEKRWGSIQKFLFPSSLKAASARKFLTSSASVGICGSSYSQLLLCMSSCCPSPFPNGRQSKVHSYKESYKAVGVGRSDPRSPPGLAVSCL